MTIIRVRLCETDRKEYGVDGELLPEQLSVSVDELLDLPAGEVEQLDRDLGMPIALFVDAMQSWSLGVAQLRRVMAWLAVRQSGRTVAYGDFQPKILRARFTREAADNPPAGPSGVSSEA